LSAAATDLGESAEQIELKQAGSAVLPKTGFNSQYLMDFLNAAGTDYVELSFKDPNSALVLRPWVEGEEAAQSRRYDCVVMPMRI
jgi:DNA polymerase III sliding clamp (beta) subunit (PCNA family)